MNMFWALTRIYFYFFIFKLKIFKNLEKLITLDF